MLDMPKFEQSFIKIGQLLPIYLDFGDGPAKKLREVLKEKQKRPVKDVAGIVREVSQANICQRVKYRRRGKRRLLWGLWEEEPEEKVSISIRGHFYTKKLLDT